MMTMFLAGGDLWKAISPSDAGDLCLFENLGNSLDAYNTQHTKRHSLLWENRKQTEVGVKWSKIISRSSILHWVRAIGWTQKECRMPRYLKSLGLGQAAGFYHIPIRSVGQHGSRHFQHINRLSTQPDPSLSLSLYMCYFKLGKVEMLLANCDNGQGGEQRQWQDDVSRWWLRGKLNWSVARIALSSFAQDDCDNNILIFSLIALKWQSWWSLRCWQEYHLQKLLFHFVIVFKWIYAD